MSVVVPFSSQIKIANSLVAPPSTGLRGVFNLVQVRLFTNAALTITKAITLADFTEPTGGWYGPLPVSWAIPVTDGEYAKLVSTPVTWVSDGSVAETIYGYWVQDTAPDLLWAEHLPGGPVDMTTAGAFIQFALVHSLKSEFTSD